MVPYKVDMGSDGNMATNDATKLRTYNCTTITQLSRCKVEIENNDKCKRWIFL